MAIVTISRELGSGGSDVASRLCKALGCRLLDKATLEDQMREYGLTADVASRYDEKKPSFWARMSSDKLHYERFLRTAVLETARRGDCVIVGRGSQVILSGLVGPIHVRVVAPHVERVERIMRRYECDEEEAARRMRQSDQDRMGFHRFFFGTDVNAPTLYDVVFNLRGLSVEQVVNSITDMVPHGLVASADGRANADLIDRCLAERVHMALIYKRQLPIGMLRVQVTRGMVRLDGQVLAETVIDQATDVLQELDDVEGIDNRLTYNRYPAPLGYGA